jgi:hypothetical protein
MSSATLTESQAARLISTWTPTSSAQDQEIEAVLKASQPVAPPPPEPVAATWGGYSAKNPMPAGKVYGSPTSAWNVNASGSILSNSSSLVGTLLSGINGPSSVGTAGRWAKPTYYASATDPKYTLKFKAPSWGGSAGPVDGKVFRIPAGAQPGLPTWAEDSNTDAHMQIVLCKADCEAIGMPYGTTVDMWKAQWEGSTLRFQSGSYGHIDGSLIGGKATAMECDLGAGLIRAQELIAGHIPHALFAVCSKSKISKGYVYPAIHTDGSGGPIPMGQRFKLAYTASEIAATSWPAYRKTIITAVAEKGLIIGDSSGNPLGLQVESGVMYTSQGVANPFNTFGSSLDVTTGVDWKGRLRAVTSQ